MTPVQFERKMKLDETVDSLRDKFGEDIIRRGKFADQPGAHMAGGLDKARRTGITKPIPDEYKVPE
jgi:DNA polymerase-4